jgi:MYXO-CTERM domain-containing protein
VDDKDLASDWSEMWAFSVIEKGGGCGCGTTSEGGPGVVFLLLALYGWAWRSKQRRQ